MSHQKQLFVETAFLNVENAGPPSFRMGPGGRVMYRRDLLDAWLAEQQEADSRSNPALSPMNRTPQRRSPRTVF
ncbi:hypothetical protein ACH4VT_23835 [Streptomyces lydicus]|uniref:hypothetical protein n=1 Tax=Streptomyces lydicus TaxID=47763 RepID=UPI0037A619C5